MLDRSDGIGPVRRMFQSQRMNHRAARVSSPEVHSQSRPELLQDAGSTTFMAGKWDLGVGVGYTPATRGFDRSFVLLDASASHFAELFWENPIPYADDGVALRIDQLPEDFYATEYYTDKMIEFMKSHDGEAPWFAYVPYTAPHPETPA